MKSLLVSDLHLTDSPKDEYRWALFPWVLSLVTEHSIDEVFILGDLTTAKDFHSARLVNKVVDAIGSLPCPVVILRGNHDGIDPECPYFRFLNRLPNVEYIIKQTELDQGYIFVPHMKDAPAYLPAICRNPGYVFLHATVAGAVSENGMRMSGWPSLAFGPNPQAKIYSGDIHVPQTVGPVEYVGAPYPIRFGDQFRGRAILLTPNAAPQSLYMPTIQRAMLTATPTCVPGWDGLNKGDQVKVRIRLAPSEYGEWHALKKLVTKECNERGIELCGVELEREPQQRSLIKKAVPATTTQANPKQMFDSYCADNKLSAEIAEAGRSLLAHTGW